ncbi:DMT family transporter [Enterovirga rhinocerotis]|uniref:EamA-like transporter family protein n=1 Tax=Enterovirga rhinocerotis TaxID=1339210 RepID=A0A4R7C8C4_9HYPH|nr:DMT family transporter [Enterovirga rhinocerotis]TDR93096.1 EamA-like transporter family protein [Enterovirga rhinocerotis]
MVGDGGISRQDQRRGAVYASMVVLLFAGFVLVSRAGLSTALTLLDIAALRFGVGAILLAPLLLGHGFGGIRPGQVLVLATLGGLGFALLAYAGFALTPSSHGGVLIHGTLALTTAVLIWLFRLPRSRVGQGVGLAIIAAGVAAMAWDGRVSGGDWMLVGDLCLIGASFCWSGYGLYVRRLGLSALQAAAIVTTTSAVVFLPIYLMLPGKMLFEAGWWDILVQGAFQGAVIGAGSVFVYTRAVVLLGPEQVSLFTAAVPALALVGGLVLLGEVPGTAAVIGVALVTIGMIAAFRPPVR